MTDFTVPRGQARALFASLLPHAGKQSDDTPNFGRVRFAPDPSELVAWTVDGASAAAGFVDVIDHHTDTADLFDLSTSALKAALAVFRGPADKDARQMWADQPLRVQVTEDAVVLTEVEELVEGRSLTVERWVTEGEDRYPDVPRTLTTHPTDPTGQGVVGADALAKFIPSAKAWDEALSLAFTSRLLQVRIRARLIGLCGAIRFDDDETARRSTWAGAWDDRLTRHHRPTPPDPEDGERP